VAYCQLNETEAQIHKPNIVHVNSENQVTFLASEEPVLV
jgi:aspartate 1-decarboxylase